MQVVVDGGKGLMTNQLFEPWPVAMCSDGTAAHVSTHKLMAILESNKVEQLQAQLQKLQEQLAKHKSQAARAEAKADHYRRVYKQAISIAR